MKVNKIIILFKEKLYSFFKKNSGSVFGGGFYMLLIIAFAHGLGYNAISFWFLAITNWIAFSLYISERRKADKRQQEINRYRKNGIKIKNSE